MTRHLRAIAAGLFLAAAPVCAEAHLVNTRLGDFYNGAFHPLTGFEFVLPWIALSILAAFQPRDCGRWLLLAFPVGLCLGTLSSFVLPNLLFVPSVNAVLIAGAGVIVALAPALPLPVFIGLAAAIAWLDGYTNGREVAFDTDRVLFVAGVTGSGYVFVTLLTALIVSFLKGKGGWRTIALRAGGSWIAAVGIMILTFQLLRVGGSS